MILLFFIKVVFWIFILNNNDLIGFFENYLLDVFYYYNIKLFLNEFNNYRYVGDLFFGRKLENLCKI